MRYRAFYENSQTWVYFDFSKSLTAEALKVHGQICLSGGKFYHFTGLQDKNGKDIYEGDTLQWLDDKKTKNGVMMWDEDAVGFRIQMPKGYFPSWKLLSKHIEIPRPHP